MVKKYPHSATISWADAGTTNSVGVFTPGTLNSIGITCDIQTKSERYIIGNGGAKLAYNRHIFSAPFTSSDSVPKRAKMRFFSADHILVHIFTFQKHVEIKCQG